MSLGEPEDLPGVVTCSLRSSGTMQSVYILIDAESNTLETCGLDPFFPRGFVFVT
jgi:hypothetical protein